MGLTKEDMTGYFTTVDSLTWDLNYAIPLQVAGTNIVKSILDTREISYMKNGQVNRVNLLEEFTLENEKMGTVRQWSAELPADM